MNIIECKNCSKIIKDKKIICEFNFTFKDDIYFLKGKNGSGKSTLLRILAKLEKLTSGELNITSENILYLTNEGVGQKFLTIRENIDLLYTLHMVNTNSECEKFISKLFDEPQLNTLYEKASLGMTLKLGCTLLAIDNYWGVIMIDETLSGIDKKSRKVLIERLEHLNKKGSVCIIIVSHNEIDKEFTATYNTLNMNKE